MRYGYIAGFLLAFGLTVSMTNALNPQSEIGPIPELVRVPFPDPNICPHLTPYRWEVRPNREEVSIKRIDGGYRDHAHYSPPIDFDSPPIAQQLLPEKLQMRLNTHIRAKKVTYEDGIGYRELGIPFEFKGFRFNGGWLTGINRGEWGGGVFWIDDRGNGFRQLARENLIAIYPVKDGALVFTGLSHMTTSTGHVVFLPESAKPPGIPIMLDLESTPSGVIPINSGGDPRSGASVVVTMHDQFLVLTKDGLIIVDGEDRTTTRIVHLPEEWGLEPFSFARSRSRSSYFIGMNHFVLKVPIENPYFYEWYAPADCPRFILGAVRCECRPLSDQEFSRKPSLIGSSP